MNESNNQHALLASFYFFSEFLAIFSFCHFRHVKADSRHPSLLSAQNLSVLVTEVLPDSQVNKDSSASLILL